MQLKTHQPKQALNLAYRKNATTSSEIQLFMAELQKLLKEMDEEEHEENTKNLMTDFLKNSFYKGEHHINTKGDIDLAIHHKNTQKSTVGVLMEVKKPGSREMIQKEQPNQKALQQLVYYYLIERVEVRNPDIKHLIATDVYNWFIFDEALFDKYIYEDKQLIKRFKAFRQESKSTQHFYKEIAQPHLEKVTDKLEATYFNLSDYKQLLKNSEGKEKIPKRLDHLYKVFSPTHLFKKPFGNDSNSLNKDFYAELLHILGLEEVKEKNKKVIQRKSKENRDYGSFLENTIGKLERSSLHRVKDYQRYGNTQEERTETIALELCITWMNRILFLKLLEAQLLDYHQGDKKYKFLNIDTISNFDRLDALFFDVLARKPKERNEYLKEDFGHIPYLNSSLFEATELESSSEHVRSLSDNAKLSLYSRTVLKDGKGKRRTGTESPLNYLFQFLDAYNFASEGKEEVRDDQKNLINASVLGLIFEKINGYKDGSFYTPSFITMYMCRETLRRVVVQKFSEHYKIAFENFDHLREHLAGRWKPEQRLEDNQLINSLKICDPAVGSGHFLVSALNELISIKADLGILANQEGRKLPVGIHVENDELFILEGGEDDFFEYKIGNTDSQNIQETLFHEKQQLIEGCLFGVDINPNSVKICRLRLWIELLKHAYYTPKSKYKELETLPNIDINIKTGNSLISRFELDADIKPALRKAKTTITKYRNAVQSYRNASSKEEKREMEQLIEQIKNDFQSNIENPFKKKMSAARGKHDKLLNEINVQKQWGNKIDKPLRDEYKKAKKIFDKLLKEREGIEENKIYENAFEWRFEFPEVLDNKGEFLGFDAIIGNPPYIRQEEISWMKPYLQGRYETYAGTADLLVFFIELGIKLLKSQGDFTFIIANKFMRAGFGQQLRTWLQTYQLTEIIDFGDLPVFEEATTYPCILSVENNSPKHLFTAANIEDLNFDSLVERLQKVAFECDQNKLDKGGWNLTDERTQALLQKLKNTGVTLNQYVEGKIYYGIKTGFNEAFVIDKETKNRLIEEDPKSAEVIKPFLGGKDIKRYSVPVVKQWLLFIPWHFPLHKDDNISGASNEAEILFKKEYPAVFKHLNKFKKQLSARNKAETGIRYEWYALQRCATTYYEEFDKPKFLLPDIAKQNEFSLDQTGGVFCVNTAYIMPVNSKALLGILNSKLVVFFYGSITSTIRGGYYRFIRQYLEQIPIVKPSEKTSTQIESIVEQILSLKQQNPEADTTALEAEIDTLVYELYGLKEEEVTIVEEAIG